MAGDREQLVRAATEAFNRKAWEEFLHLLHPDIEWVETQQYPGASTYHGHDGVRESLEKWWESWGTMTTTVDQVVEEGDTVVTLGRTAVTGTTSELSFESESGIVYEFEDDLVVRARFFLSKADALAAAGLGQ